MAFIDLINKGVELVNKGVQTGAQKAKEKKEEMSNYSLLITKSNHLTGLMPYKVNNSNPQVGREQMILNACLSLNLTNAKLVNELIPVEETIINAKLAEESKTKMTYIFAITDRKLWVLNEKEYKCYEFFEISKFEIVNRSLMSQGTNFNENAFSIEGRENDVQLFIDTINDPNIKLTETNKATSYLCGQIPYKQYININLAGISICNNNNLVLHNGKLGNRVVKIDQIKYMQILLDNTVVYMKGVENQNQISAETNARKISLKFEMTTESYIIDVMPQNMLGTIVKKEDTNFQNNINFCKRIIDEILNIIR